MEDSNGEESKRVKIAISSDNVKTAKKVQFWATVGFSLVAAGFSAAMFLGGFAKADHHHMDIDERMQVIEAHADDDRHAAEEDRKRSAEDRTTNYEQYKYLQIRIDKIFEQIVTKRRSHE